jgi:hypothetical protein
MSNISCVDQTNINFLNDNSFKFNLLNSPNVNFFCTKVNIPELSIDIAKQSTLYNEISYPGDELNYGDLIVTFKLQENLKDYMEIFTWITNSAHPINLTDLYEQQLDVKNNLSGSYKGESNSGGIFSDAILEILDNNLNPKFYIKFYNCFPIRLSSVEFNTEVSDASPLQCTAAFKYLYFTINA